MQSSLKMEKPPLPPTKPIEIYEDKIRELAEKLMLIDAGKNGMREVNYYLQIAKEIYLNEIK